MHQEDPKKLPKDRKFPNEENELETLRKIGKSICPTNGVVGREMRKSFGCQSTLISTTLGIAESLSDEEMDRLKPWCNDKLIVLQRFANDYYVFEDLGEVKDLRGADREAEH